MAALTICNVAGSSLVRESDLAFMTRAGVEVGGGIDKSIYDTARCIINAGDGTW